MTISRNIKFETVHGIFYDTKKPYRFIDVQFWDYKDDSTPRLYRSRYQENQIQGMKKADIIKYVENNIAKLTEEAGYDSDCKIDDLDDIIKEFAQPIAPMILVSYTWSKRIRKRYHRTLIVSYKYKTKKRVMQKIDIDMYDHKSMEQELNDIKKSILAKFEGKRVVIESHNSGFIYGRLPSAIKAIHDDDTKWRQYESIGNRIFNRAR